MSFRSMDPHVGTREEVAVRLNCDKNGCPQRHSDHGKVMWVFDPYREANEIARLMNGGEFPVNDHATDVIRRTIVLPEWEVVS